MKLWISRLAGMVALALCAVCSLGVQPSYAGAPQHLGHYYAQLSQDGKEVFDCLEEAFLAGAMKDGITPVDITSAFTAEDISNYKENGNRKVFEAFSEAKDAFDLAHPDAWYIDSSFLTLRVGTAGATLKAYIGAGASDTYYLDGVTRYITDDKGTTTTLDAQKIDAMDKQLKQAESKIVSDIRAEITPNGQESQESYQTRLMKAAHDKVIRTISYRFEDECKPASSLFVRTTYAAVTHEGVCESYVRLLSWVISDLGIDSIPVAGMQTGGDEPERHMWLYVPITPDGANGEPVWYAIDPTWDDPIRLDSAGKVVNDGANGLDGREVSTYFLVGADKLADWVPNGTFSANGKNFELPALSRTDYEGATVAGDAGLSITYSSAGEMEDAPAGVFTIAYNGGSILNAAKDGVHVVLREVDVSEDGSEADSGFCYLEALMAIMQGANKNSPGNPYFHDTDKGFILSTATCEYIQVGLVNETPQGYENWWNTNTNINPLFNLATKDPTVYKGTSFIYKSDELRNVNASYEAQPYVFTQYPSATTQTSTEATMAKVIFDDALMPLEARQGLLDLGKTGGAVGQNTKFKPGQDTPYTGDEATSGANDVNDYFRKLSRVPESAVNFSRSGVTYDATTTQIKVAYTTVQRDPITGQEVPHKIQGELPFDRNKDGYVDENTAHFNWLFECNISYPHKHSVWGYEDAGKSCKLVGVEFAFDPSDKWADDLTYYQFSVVGVRGGKTDPSYLVGYRSGKAANSWGYLVSAPLCPMAYRSQGIDWALWGQPNLLDNPDDLDLQKFTMTDSAGDTASLQELQKRMNLERLNGRLMLTVEDLSSNRDRVDEMESVLKNPNLNKGAVLEEGAIASRSLFEVNFTNMCRKTLSEVETGDSMRVQVGFPAGYNAESPVVFKAYHFTRDDAGNIISVEEIPVVVTEYGLLVLCDSFSPFEMVAVDPAKTSGAASDAKLYDDAVVVATNGHVTVEADGADVTTGAASIVSLNKDGSRTFTFTPEDGYAIEGVTFAGSVQKLGDGAGDGVKTLTLSKADMEALEGADKMHTKGLNTILSVTSVPEKVLEIEKEEGFTAEVATVCSHIGSVSGGVYKAATCTQDGYLTEKTCTKCGSKLADAVTYPATGHALPVDFASVKVPATCTEPGVAGEEHCTVCKELIQGSIAIPATGHGWGNDGVCATCKDYNAEKDMVLTSQRLYLENKLKEAAALRAEDYTAESWRVLTAAVEAARGLMDTAPTLDNHVTLGNQMTEAEGKVARALGVLVRVDGGGSSGDGGGAGGGGGSQGVPVYRLYNDFDKVHLFTTDVQEYRTLKGNGWNDEGVAWYAPAKGAGAYTIVRLYNPFSHDHYYLRGDDQGQLGALLSAGWTKDSELSWFDSAAPGVGVEVTTLYNPYRSVDTHIWTANAYEARVNVDMYGWEKHATTMWAASVPR